MKQFNDLNLAALASGLEKLLSDDIGGEFKATVQKMERTAPGTMNDKVLLSFVVADSSHMQRWMEGDGSSWKNAFKVKETMTFDEFRQTATRTETEADVTYDVRPLGEEQQLGVAVFLEELVFRLGLGTLRISKPVVLVVDSNFENTEQLDGFIQKLTDAGLSVRLQQTVADSA